LNFISLSDIEYRYFLWSQTSQFQDAVTVIRSETDMYLLDGVYCLEPYM